MQNIPKIILIIAFLATIHAELVCAKPTRTRTTERIIFNQAEIALKKNNLALYEVLAKQLTDYPLYPYLKYTKIQQNIGQISITELQDFLQQYPDSPLGVKLRDSWLYTNARNKNWRNFIAGYQYSDNVELQCNYIWGHYQINRDPAILKYAEPIWLNGTSQPAACNDVFAAWEKHHSITRAILWQRIKLAIHSNNPQLARFLANKLKKSEVPIVELWIRTNDNPYLINKQHYFTAKHPAIVEILVHGITKIAAKNPKDAICAWKHITKHHPFTEKHWATVVKNIGVSLAKAKHPETEKWLSKIAPNYLDQATLETRLHFALHSKNWRNIIKISKHLPSPLDKSEQWLYWKARSLEILGDKPASQPIFQQIADHRSYYGFLASVKLGAPYTFKHQAIKINEADLIRIAQNPALVRAHELHQIGRHDKGTLEWNYAIRSMTDKEKEVAAAIAAKWKIPNWSITALMNSHNKNNLLLRFPQTYSRHIIKEAQHNNIDPALIFAITRQESAFITTAKSSAGALGLMQLVPSTAKMVAQRINERLNHEQELLSADKNIRLGSKYLQMMLTQYRDKSVLAAAAYNAGPGRIRQWLPQYDMPADTWIESIPFKETRNYVKNILTYTVIYQQLLGRSPCITAHMPLVPGAARLINLSAQAKTKSAPLANAKPVIQRKPRKISISQATTRRTKSTASSK